MHLRHIDSGEKVVGKVITDMRVLWAEGGPETVTLNAPGDPGFDFGEGMGTRAVGSHARFMEDDQGRHVFALEGGSKAPFSCVELFTDGMSSRTFFVHPVHIEVMVPGGAEVPEFPVALAKALGEFYESLEGTDVAARHCWRPRESFEVNACHAALFLQDTGAPEKYREAFGIDEEGRPLVRDENRGADSILFIPDEALDPDLAPHNIVHLNPRFSAQIGHYGAGIRVFDVYENLDGPDGGWRSSFTVRTAPGGRFEVGDIIVKEGFLIQTQSASMQGEQHRGDEDDRCRTCLVYYAPGGDGFDGECPSCADRTDSELNEPDVH